MISSGLLALPPGIEIETNVGEQGETENNDEGSPSEQWSTVDERGETQCQK
jgi:hypothetical protein